MKMILWLAGVIILLVLLLFLGLAVCFYIAFYAHRDKKKDEAPYPLPTGALYEPYHGQMLTWMKEMDEMPALEMEITSFDGLRLRGRFYKYADNAPIELMFPGYRGHARRDFSGGVQRCFALGHSALIVDQRACGRSEGHVISFGVNESRDCLGWIEEVIKTIGPESKIILTGISMGAATVMIAAGEELPENVAGVLADCGYSSAEAIIKKVIKDMKLPVVVVYPLVRLSGKLFGGFDVEKAVPIDALKRAKVPVLLAHGDADAFVPCTMSRENYESCTTEKKLIMVPDAGHCLCYPINIEHYIRELKAFWESVGIY